MLPSTRRLTLAIILIGGEGEGNGRGISFDKKHEAHSRPR